MWLEVNIHMAGWETAIARAWNKEVSRLTAARSRWQKVNGHMGAVIATLLDMEWAPLGPMRWKDPSGQEWEISPGEPAVKGQMKQVLQQAIVRQQWAKAAQHFAGKGLEAGVDLTVAKRHLRQLRRQGQHKDAGLLMAILQGAIWPKSRRAEAGWIPDGTCTRCNQAEDTGYHQMWECEELTTEHRGDAEEHKYRLRGAVVGHVECPGFWLRGLVPEDWTNTAQPTQEYRMEWGALKGVARYSLPQGAFASTDGTGGPDTMHTRLRRVGWGFVVFFPPMQIVSWCNGGLVGAQSVPRAELKALIELLDRTEGDVEVFVDCASVVIGWRKHPRSMQGAANLDLWQQLWAVREGRRGKVTVTKTKAHCTDAEIDAGEIGGLEFLANAAADEVAKLAGHRLRLDEHQRSSVLWVDEMAYRVQQHLLDRCKQILDSDLYHQELQQTRLRRRGSKSNKRQVVATRRLKRRLQLSSWLRNTQHSVRKGKRGWLQCRQCMIQARPGPWLEQPCEPSRAALQAAGIHPSHKVRSVKGIVACWSCGCWSARRLVKLRSRCSGVLNTKASSRRVLEALEKGQLPPGCTAWPAVEGAELRVGPVASEGRSG